MLTSSASTARPQGRRRPAQAYIRAVGAWLRTRCWFFNLIGSAKLDRLLEVFTYASKRYGVRHFVIDSLMMIDVPVDGPGALSAQKIAVQKLTDFAKRHGAHMHLVAHPRKGRDDGGIPGKMDVAGSADITNAADNVFVVWRNKKDEAAVNQDDPAAVEAWQKKMAEPDAKLILSKSRHGDVQDYTLALWWDKESMQYRTQSRHHELRFVEFSTQEAFHADPQPERAAPRPFFSKHPDLKPSSIWVLLWSQQQCALHVETLADMMESHARAFAGDRALQYIPLVIGDREVIDHVAEAIRPTLHQRQDAQTAARDAITRASAVQEAKEPRL